MVSLEVVGRQTPDNNRYRQRQKYYIIKLNYIHYLYIKERQYDDTSASSKFLKLIYRYIRYILIRCDIPTHCDICICIIDM